MLKQVHAARSVTALLSCAVGLAGCGTSPLSGRRIIDDLERSRIPLPDQVGHAVPADSRIELPAEGPIGLADLMNVAQARNPSLAAVRSEVGIAAGQRWQASLYPNPRFDVVSEDISWRDGLSDAKSTIGFTQPFVLSDRRQAAMQAADAEQAERLADVEARQRVLFGEIAAEHVRIISVRDQRKLYQELRDFASRTIEAADARFKAQAAPETDVIRPRVEIHRLDAALARLEHEQAASVRRLSLLLGGVQVDISRLEGSLPTAPASIDLQRLETDLRTTHPELAVADRNIEAAAARFEQVRAERTPDLDVRVGVGYRGESDDGIVELGAGMTIPLWDAQEGNILSARFRLMQARQDRAAIENALLTRLATATGEYESARAQFIAFRDQIVPDAQRAFDQTGEGYRSGHASFIDLLDSQRTLTEARITLIELGSSVAAARAAVLQIVGPEALDQPLPDSVSSHSVPPTIHMRRQGAEVTQ